MNDYRLTQFGEDILEDVKTFCLREVRGEAVEIDRSHADPEALYAKAGEMGLTSLFVSDEQGGTGFKAEELAALLEEIASHDAGLAVTLAANGLALQPVTLAGSDQQKAFCSDLLMEGGYGAFCLTEDDAGSDISRIRTTAVMTERGYVLNGSKTMITNAPNASFYTVAAMLDGELTMFLVPGESAGIHRESPEEKMGLRTSLTGGIGFQDVELSAGALIGARGDGKRLAAETLQKGRVFCAAMAVGIGRRAIEEATVRVKEREQFRTVLSENPAVQAKIAEMYLRKASAQSCVIRACEIMDGERSGNLELISSAAKCLASDAAVYCALEAIQLFGGYGYSRDYPVEKLLRDAKAFQIFEGTNEIQRSIIGRSIISQN